MTFWPISKIGSHSHRGLGTDGWKDDETPTNVCSLPVHRASPWKGCAFLCLLGSSGERTSSVHRVFVGERVRLCNINTSCVCVCNSVFEMHFYTFSFLGAAKEGGGLAVGL